ncbi:MAG: hypothetical protein ABFR05_08595, partial [Bacteroidota bacterium]
QANTNDEELKENLQNLKETLVITTGDNYVGASEPQLREKVADLYSKVASSYDKPTSSELENLDVLEERFSNAKKDFDKLKQDSETEDLQLKSFEEFISE